MSNMLDAFIKQTYGSLEGAEEADKKAAAHEAMMKELPKLWEKKAIEHSIEATKPISERIAIPTRLKAGDLDQKAEVHKALKNYDHSLEKDRLAELRARYNYVEPDHSDSVKEIGEMEISTEQYERVDPSTVPNLNGIFDNLFGLGGT